MPTILMQHADHGHMHVYSAPERVTAEAAGWTIVVAEPVKAPEPAPVAILDLTNEQFAEARKRPYNRRK